MFTVSTTGVRLAAYDTALVCPGADTQSLCTYQVYSLPAMERLQTIATETPINYTAMSPDMRSLAAVGDTPQL